MLVDDEVDLLEILSEFLEDAEFEVVTAKNGMEALSKLKTEKGFDLFLSDINMPGMKGFELINEVRKRYPRLRSALITAYDINSYIELAKKYNVGNIIAKTSPFNFDDFGVHVASLVSGEIFGLERHLSENRQIENLVIKDAESIEPSIQRVFELFTKHSRGNRMKTAVREVVVNAVFYGARSEDGAKKDEWDLDVVLPEDEYVTIEFGKDDEKIGVSVIDQKGRLAKSDVLFWLKRNIARDAQTGLVQSIHDEHGRGIFISREFIDSFVINVDPGKKTEIILLNYHEEKFKGFKPLIINEL